MGHVMSILANADANNFGVKMIVPRNSALTVVWVMVYATTLMEFANVMKVMVVWIVHTISVQEIAVDMASVTASRRGVYVGDHGEVLDVRL